MLKLNQIQVQAHRTADRRNQLTANTTITLLAKLMREAGEAVDAVVKNRIMDVDTFNEKSDNFYSEFENQVKNTLGDELADVVLYALIIAEENHLNLEKHIQCKLKYNDLRP